MEPLSVVHGVNVALSLAVLASLVLVGLQLRRLGMEAAVARFYLHPSRCTVGAACVLFGTALVLLAHFVEFFAIPVAEGIEGGALAFLLVGLLTFSTLVRTRKSRDGSICVDPRRVRA